MASKRWVWAVLAVGLVAASQSGNIVRLGDAHPVVIAGWRLLIASLLLAPLAGGRLRELRRLSRQEVGLLLVAAAALATHFFAWIAAVQITTVANAATFFAVNPVFTALGGYWIYREAVSSRLALSILTGFAGVAVIAGGDLRWSPEHLIGDVLAVICSILFTVYFLAGKPVRDRLSSGTYVTALYACAAGISFLVLWGLGLPVTGYSSRTWLCFLLMALVPTMIGHTSFNFALRYVPAARISAATLTEPLMAGLVAYFAWGEAVTRRTLGGYVLITLSVLLLMMDALKASNRTAPVGVSSP